MKIVINFFRQYIVLKSQLMFNPCSVPKVYFNACINSIQFLKLSPLGILSGRKLFAGFWWGNLKAKVMKAVAY
jgi:hypothetical protein